MNHFYSDLGVPERKYSVINFFPCSTQKNMKYILLINVKMATMQILFSNTFQACANPVVVLGFNVPSTAKVIWKQGHGL